MKPMAAAGRKILVATVFGWLLGWAGGFAALAAPSDSTTNRIQIVEVQGEVRVMSAGATNWVLTRAGQELHPADQVRTGPNSRATLQWPGPSIEHLGPDMQIEILPPAAAGSESGLHLLRGLFYFFHRGEAERFRMITHAATAGVMGTEFAAKVETINGRERTTIWVIDGEVVLANDFGTLFVTNGQSAVADFGQAPRLQPAGYVVNNILQWCFYYPAVLDLHDLPLAAEEQNSLSASLAAYRDGDLLAALSKYPVGRQPGSDAERIYFAALLLAGGNVEQTEDVLATLTATDRAGQVQRLANALRTLIAAVKGQPRPAMASAALSTELLARSYYEQSRATGEDSLKRALELARQAATRSLDFGFAWERVAELEFSFGRTRDALDALTKSLRLSPRNAQALALNGFLFAAQNKIGKAHEKFEEAIAVDAGLANAWLGRGLCRIHRGDVNRGREDLLIAAALEPQRAALRSYLGKAYADAGDRQRARHELDLAKGLDPADPTSWLYSALLNEQENRVNEGIRDLETSKELNENRNLYRSQFLLDQDRAVRSANLARIYDEAGLGDVAVREAARAVAADYANFSAHLFLANSYGQLLRSSPYDLRFDSPALSEYLIANLLGPADGRLLAQPVSQQEYSRLFERDYVGLSSSTEYLSRGAWNQYAAQYGALRNSSYALEADYSWDPGETIYRHNESRQLSAKVKQLLTPSDGLYFQVFDSKRTSGDLSRRYDPNDARDVTVQEKESPTLLLGLDHQWNENNRTLLLASRFDDSLHVSSPAGATYLVTEFFGMVDGFVPTDLTQTFQNRLTVDSLEVQHLLTTLPFQTIAGLRLQYGTYRLQNEQTIYVGNAGGYEGYFGDPGTLVADQSLRLHSSRVSPYLYEYWNIVQPLWLIGGLSYDYQRRPNNATFAPLDDGEQTQHYLSPKAAVVWTPTARTAVRAAYSRSLSGADLDQSVRLEPTQLAGFVQAYRDLIPASLVGSVGGTRVETADLAFEQRWKTGTYFAVAGQWLHSTADPAVGAFEHDPMSQGPTVQLREELRYREWAADTSVHQLVGDWFTVGARYHVAEAKLDRQFPEIDPGFGNGDTGSGLLQSVHVNLLFRHPTGFFAEVEGQWWLQHLSEGLSAYPDERFWQENFLLGYRSPRRTVELATGVLNLSGQDYRLHPINLYPAIPRERTFFIRLLLNF